MIRLFLPALLVTTMLTTASIAQAAQGGLAKHDASIAQYSYSVPIVDNSSSLATSGGTLQQDLDKGYKPSAAAPRAMPVYSNRTATSSTTTTHHSSTTSASGSAAAQRAAAMGGMGKPAVSKVAPVSNSASVQTPEAADDETTNTGNDINAGSASVTNNAVSSETSPTAPISRNSTDSIRSSNAGSTGSTTTGSTSTSGSTAVSGPLGSTSGAATNGSSGFTGDSSNSGSSNSASTGGSDGGSSSMGGRFRSWKRLRRSFRRRCWSGCKCWRRQINLFIFIKKAASIAAFLLYKS